MAIKLPNTTYTRHQIIVHKPREPELAVRAWVARSVRPARKFLAENIRLLPAKDIHDLIHELIEELDNRSGDTDVEPELIEDDDESEVEVIEDDDEAEPEPAEEDDVLVNVV